jgi:parallel beta-helix repeat protein
MKIKKFSKQQFARYLISISIIGIIAANIGYNYLLLDQNTNVEKSTIQNNPLKVPSPAQSLSPRIIDDLGGGDYTWAEAAADAGNWCSGTGTQGDPYTLDGHIFNASQTASSLIIQNTNAHFQIINCQFLNASGVTEAAPLTFNNVSNAYLSHNNFSTGPDTGFYLQYSSNIVIHQNNFSATAYGLYVDDWCSDITITNNFFNALTIYGIYISKSSQVSISSNDLVESNYPIKAVASILVFVLNNHIINTDNTAISFNNVTSSEIQNNNIENTKNSISVAQYSTNNLIQNNTAYYMDRGIYLANYAVNNVFHKNNFHNISINGIEITTDCIKNNFTYNLINRTHSYGIYMRSGSALNFLYNNSILHGDYRGIFLDNCDSNKFESNYVYNHSNAGILIYSTSDYNEFRGNYIDGNNGFYGVRISFQCTGTLITQNTIKNHNYGFTTSSTFGMNIVSDNLFENHITGILFAAGETDSIISGNTVKDCSWEGIYVQTDRSHIYGNLVINNSFGIRTTLGADSNQFNNNYLINNTNNVDDAGLNSWMVGSLGSYWENYTGVDANFDGIGDTPYIVYRQGKTDNKPIWDLYKPEISVLNSNLTFVEQNNTNQLSWEIGDRTWHNGNVRLLLNDNQISTTAWTANGTLSYNISSFAPGLYTFKVIAKDGFSGKFDIYNEVGISAPVSSVIVINVTARPPVISIPCNTTNCTSTANNTTVNTSNSTTTSTNSPSVSDCDGCGISELYNSLLMVGIGVLVGGGLILIVKRKKVK